MSNLKETVQEFRELKEKLFNGESFVEESKEQAIQWKRYDELLKFIYPSFNTIKIKPNESN